VRGPRLTRNSSEGDDGRRHRMAPGDTKPQVDQPPADQPDPIVSTSSSDKEEVPIRASAAPLVAAYGGPAIGLRRSWLGMQRRWGVISDESRRRTRRSPQCFASRLRCRGLLSHTAEHRVHQILRPVIEVKALPQLVRDIVPRSCGQLIRRNSFGLGPTAIGGRDWRRCRARIRSLPSQLHLASARGAATSCQSRCSGAPSAPRGRCRLSGRGPCRRARG
jgi:hypothetical protein